MLINLYRSIGLVVCLATLSFVGCSEDGGEASAYAAGDEQVQTASFAMTTEPVAQDTSSGTGIVIPSALDDSKPKSSGKDGPTTAPARPAINITRGKTGFDLSASGLGTQRDLLNTSVSTNPEDYIVKAEPASLDLGEVGAGDKAKGSFRLVNTGNEPMRIVKCKANCGCTVPKCPTNTVIEPGESFEVEVVMTAQKKSGRQTKRIDIVVDGQPLLRVPVSADVVVYLEISPRFIGPNANSDGRMVIRSLDETPFRITGMIPPLIEDGIAVESEPQLEHVLFLSWDVWKDKGSPRLLKFTTDHPRVKELSITVQSPRPSIRNPRNRRAIATINPDNAVAARTGDVEKILAVTKTKEDLELVDAGGATLLAIAASAGQTEVVNALLQADAKPDAMDSRGRTPLLAAVQKRDTNIQTMNALILGGADVNARDKVAGVPILSWAAGPLGSVEKVRVLLEAGCDVNGVDSRGDTALIWATRFGTAETVKAMLQAGADVSIVNKKGVTALTYISARQRTDESVITEITSLLEESANTQD